MLFAFYVACTVVPIAIVIYVIAAAVLRGSAQSVLCMECEQCVAVCPLLRKGRTGFLGPKEIMTAARSGRWREAVEAGALRCTSCGLCERVCPRGLSPCRELEMWRQQARKASIGPFAPGANQPEIRSSGASGNRALASIGDPDSAAQAASGTAVCCGTPLHGERPVHGGMGHSLGHKGEAS